MKAKLVIIIILAVAAIFVAAFLTPGNIENREAAGNNRKQVATSSESAVAPVGLNLGLPVSVKDRAWSVLEQYLEYAKEHDLDGIKRLSYQLSDACKNPETIEDCRSRMDTVYFFGSQFKKEDFNNIWSDSKQIILATDYKNDSGADIATRTRMIIFFVIDMDEIKMLRFNPAQGAFLPKTDYSPANLEKRLIELTADEDQDGIEDYVENCAVPNRPGDCVKTSPEKKDSDGDGFWDGVQAQFYKNN